MTRGKQTAVCTETNKRMFKRVVIFFYSLKIQFPLPSDYNDGSSFEVNWHRVSGQMKRECGKSVSNTFEIHFSIDTCKKKKKLPPHESLETV